MKKRLVLRQAIIPRIPPPKILTQKTHLVATNQTIAQAIVNQTKSVKSFGKTKSLFETCMVLR